MGYIMRKSYRYPLLNDLDWLRQKYEVDGLSTVKMADIAGAKSPNSVRQSLLRHGIPVRTIGDSLVHKRKDDGFTENKDIIEGSLLGDGFLQKWNKHSHCATAYFAKRNKYYDHVRYVAKDLFPSRPDDAVVEKKEKRGTIFTIRSLSHKWLNPYFDRWYPEWSNREKVVPEDIVLTPKVLLHWFLDDGSSYRRKRKTNQVIIVLSSECFSLENQQMLCDKMKSTFDIYGKPYPTNSGVGYRITIPQSQTSEFYKVIGSPPVASLSYKWK